MKVKRFTVGAFQTNCYIASDESARDAVIIDPGFTESNEERVIVNYVDSEELTLRYILNTHGHPDHTCGNKTIKSRYNVPILVHHADAFLFGQTGRQISVSLGFDTFSPDPDRLLHDGEIVSLRNFSFTVLHTPGHSPGSICLLGERDLFTGDTLFEGSIGRTDFPSSSEIDMAKSLERLTHLESNLKVFPGHGFETTLEKEKMTNPFLR